MDLLILASISLNCLVCFCYLLIFSGLNPHSLIPSLAVSNLFNLTTEFLNFNDFYFHFPQTCLVLVSCFLFTYSISFILIVILNMIWQYVCYLITCGFSEEYLILLFVASTKFCCNVPCNLRVWTHIHQGFAVGFFFFFSVSDGIHIISEYLYVWFCQMSHRYHWLATVFNNDIPWVTIWITDMNSKPILDIFQI